MRSRLGYLTSKQRRIWQLKNEGLTKTRIGLKLKIRPQAVHKSHNFIYPEFLHARLSSHNLDFFVTAVVFGRKIRGR